MKRFVLLGLLLFISTGVFAQDDKKNEVEVGLGFYVSDANSFVNVGGSLTYRYYLSGKFGIGAGFGYEYDISTIEDGGHKGSFIPVFANMQCNLPMSKKTYFIVGMNGGGALSFGNGIRNNAEFYGLIAPQIGLGFDVGNYGKSIQVKAGYKYVGDEHIGSSWGFNLSWCW